MAAMPARAATLTSAYAISRLLTMAPATSPVLIPFLSLDGPLSADPLSGAGEPVEELPGPEAVLVCVPPPTDIEVFAV